MTKTRGASDEIQAYRIANTNLKIADIPVSETGPVLLCDVSTGTPRPIVPIHYRLQLLDVIHSLAHPGSKGQYYNDVGMCYVMFGYGMLCYYLMLIV